MKLITNLVVIPSPPRRSKIPALPEGIPHRFSRTLPGLGMTLTMLGAARFS